MKKLFAVALLFVSHTVIGMDDDGKIVPAAAQAESGLKQLEYPDGDTKSFMIDAQDLSESVPFARIGWVNVLSV